MDKNIVCWPFCYSVHDAEKAERNKFEAWKKEQIKNKLSVEKETKAKELEKDPKSKEIKTKNKEIDEYQTFSSTLPGRRSLSLSDIPYLKSDPTEVENYNLLLKIKQTELVIESFNETVKNMQEDNIRLRDLLEREISKNIPKNISPENISPENISPENITLKIAEEEVKN